MKLLFDARILTHKIYSGVENYTKHILRNIKEIIPVSIAKPQSENKYLAHLWTHFVLPFKDGDLLFSPANIAPIYIPKRKKLVMTLHDVAFVTQKESFSAFFRYYYRMLVPLNIKRSERIITVSQASKQDIEKYYPFAKGKIEVIYLGVDKNFRQMQIQKKKQILYVGSMNERKNFVGIIKAFKLLDKSDYQLVIIGNFYANFDLSEDAKEVLQSALESEKISFKSNVTNEELIRLYNESELFVFPSFYEGFGLPVLEAMACGTPIITSNLSSLPEVGGDAALYCDPYDVGDIKEKMEMVLNNKELQKEMIEKGLARVKQFSWEKAAKEHLKIFDEVLQS